MKVYLYPSGLDGCGYYRMIYPARVLQAQGHDVVVVRPEHRDDERFQLSGNINNGVVTGATYPADADVIVLQRVTHKYLCQAVPFIRAAGVTVVVDMDDDLGRVHPANPGYIALHPKSATDHSWEHAQYATAAASWVTTSTDALQKVYAPHGRGSVLRNVIPERGLAVDHAAVDNGSFGWTGTVRTHPDDPGVMGSAVQRLVREGLPFYMAGNPTGIEKVFGLDAGTLRSSGVVDISEWLDTIAALHVGVAPLADTLFNASKSWLKPLELAAVGVPCVMSPRAEYRRLSQKHGIGILAPTTKDWYRQVRTLMTDRKYWDDVSTQSRNNARHLTVENNAWRWAEAWTHAYRLEHDTVLV